MYCPFLSTSYRRATIERNLFDLLAISRWGSPPLADIGECIALSCLHRIGGQHSRESDQRCSRSAVGIHRRLDACSKPASPFGGSRRGFPPVNCRDPIVGLTELPPRVRVPALTCRRSANVAPIRSLV